MLEVAVKFEKTFERMAEEDDGFKSFFGIIEGEDWEYDSSLDGGRTNESQLQRGAMGFQKFQPSLIGGIVGLL